jgi:hypothetical protein
MYSFLGAWWLYNLQDICMVCFGMSLLENWLPWFPHELPNWLTFPVTQRCTERASIIPSQVHMSKCGTQTFSINTREWVETQVLRVFPRSTELYTLGMDHRNRYFIKFPRWFWCRWKFDQCLTFNFIFNILIDAKNVCPYQTLSSLGEVQCLVSI